MLIIMDEPYLTDKEASKRYGYSQSWFQRMRAEGKGPKTIQIIKGGRVLYPQLSTDEWFIERMKEKESS